MFEHHENYDRYIPDVMLKKHKKHEEYLNDVYAGMSHEGIYKSKLGTVEDALAIIESGDCIVNSIHGCEPRLFYRNLHRIAGLILAGDPVADLLGEKGGGDDIQRYIHNNTHQCGRHDTPPGLQGKLTVAFELFFQDRHLTYSSGSPA